MDDTIRFVSEKPKDHDTVIVNKQNNKEEKRVIILVTNQPQTECSKAYIL